MSKTINFILQGKGGVGKSLVATLLGNYFLDRLKPLNEVPFCIDTDKTNTSFAEVTALNVKHYDIADSKNKLRPEELDQITSDILGRNVPAVIDNGSNSWAEISGYISNYGVSEFLTAPPYNRTVIVHTIISRPDRTLDETITELRSSLKKDNKLKYVIWKNQYPSELTDDNNILIDRITQDFPNKILGVINLPDLSETYDFLGLAFQKMLDKHLTFSEALASPDSELNGLVKQRLLKVKELLYTDFDKSGFFNGDFETDDKASHD